MKSHQLAHGGRDIKGRSSDSISEAVFANPSAANAGTAEELNKVNSWSGESDKALIGTTATEAADALLTGGWPAGAKRAKESLSALSIAGVHAIRRKPTWCDDGDEISIDRLRDGHETFWRGSTRVPTSAAGTQLVSIVVNNAKGGFATAENIFWAGAATAVLVDALEQSGRRVAVHVANYASGGFPRGVDSFFSFRVKAYDEPLDFERLVTWTSHSVAYRACMFRFMASHPERLSSHFGSPCNDPPPFELLGFDSESFWISGVNSLKEAVAVVDSVKLKLEADSGF